MRYITKIITKIISKESPKPMGRWNIDYCNKKLNKKIDLSNEDHCGPCGEYAIIKNKELKNEIQANNFSKKTDKSSVNYENDKI
jgi:hypothetical protein